MKKISMFLLTFIIVVTLTGCKEENNNNDVITSNTCILKEEDGVQQTYKLTATNDEIDKVELTIVYDNKIFEVDTLSTLSEEQKDQIKSDMLTNLGLENTTYEGLDINIDIQDQMTVYVKADLEKADKEILKKVGLDFTGADMSLGQAVRDMTASGASCQ